MGRNLDTLSRATPSRGCLSADLNGMGRLIIARIAFLDLHVVEPDGSVGNAPGDVIVAHIRQYNTAQLIAGPIGG